jgi:plasmid maintenance system antidote protein VapI
MSIKEKKPINPHWDRLEKDADKVIKKINTLGLKQEYIAEKIDIAPRTLSRFMNKHSDYVTRSLIDRLQKFLEDK